MPWVAGTGRRDITTPGADASVGGLDSPSGWSLLNDLDDGVVHLADRIGVLGAVDQGRESRYA